MPRSGDTLARAVAGLAVAAGAVLVTARAYDGLATTRESTEPAATRAASDTDRQFACVEEAVPAVAPAGTKVFVAIEDSLWHQRTSTAAFPELTVVSDPADAALVIGLGDPAATDACAAGFLETSPGGAR